MNFSEILSLIFALLIGSGGGVGICVYLIKRAIDSRLSKYEKEAEEVAALKKELGDADSRLHHAYGRMFFWIYRAIVSGKYSSELEKAFRELEDAENARKKVEREIVSRFSSEK
ncbi:MAG: hypothetical protein E7633_05855 [Ruminococcaceae bacterium]|nr:hypothetical protein [Oscillospiraceae bacterium]